MLITLLGHTGFIGQHMEKHIAGLKTHTVSGFSFPEVDLADWESAEKIAPALSPETHLICLSGIKRQFADDIDTYVKNMKIVENLSRLLETHPVRQVLFFSSAAVYGEETENVAITEETVVNPTSYYGMAKYASERLLMKTCEKAGIESLICLRPPLIYGPGDEGRTYGPSGFCAAAHENKPITLWGDGSELREFLYVGDVCRIVESLLDSKFSGALNMVSGRSHTFADIVAVLETRFPDLAVESRARSKSKVDNAFDSGRIRSLLLSDFSFTSLENGIRAIIEARTAVDDRKVKSE